MRKYRSPKIKDRTIKAQWGKLPDDAPDLCFTWGLGTQKADMRLLQNALCSKRHNPINGTWEDSVVDELMRRGYDITTLKFSVQLKEPKCQE